MQDIDFDELDRAVNSTLDSKPGRDETPSDGSVSVPVSRPEPSNTSSTPPVARRSSGRFMDVVHPSSDMRSSGASERSAPRPPEPQEAEPTPPETTNTDTTWPDPLDFHGFKDDEPTETPAMEAQKEDDSTKPLESPFLSDTKVEKRPLGAFSTDDAPTPGLAAVPSPVEPKDEETPLLEAPDEELLPAETETMDEPEVPEIAPEPDPTPAPADEPIGPTSITQQYREQPSTSDQPSGAIYDTEAYHQALTHPVKKKSGALVIVWIVALILVGAGVGAGVYFFILPML